MVMDRERHNNINELRTRRGKGFVCVTTNEKEKSGGQSGILVCFLCILHELKTRTLFKGISLHKLAV